MQLAVTDGSGQTSTCSIKDGFVATDANGVVVSTNPAVDLLLGPQIRLGKNPWAWFDDRQVAEAALQTANLAPYYSVSSNPSNEPWNVAATGTIGVTNNSPIVTGSGSCRRLAAVPSARLPFRHRPSLKSGIHGLNFRAAPGGGR